MFLFQMAETPVVPECKLHRPFRRYDPEVVAVSDSQLQTSFPCEAHERCSSASLSLGFDSVTWSVPNAAGISSLLPEHQHQNALLVPSLRWSSGKFFYNLYILYII